MEYQDQCLLPSFQDFLQISMSNGPLIITPMRTLLSNARSYPPPIVVPPSRKQPLTTNTNDIGGSISPLSKTRSTNNKKSTKKYLKETDRCAIVRRVQNGEKQAKLAKEYGVSRAAICYLCKHQSKILRRLSQKINDNLKEKILQSGQVHVIHSLPLMVLMSKQVVQEQDGTSDLYTSRIHRLLIEEALAKYRDIVWEEASSKSVDRFVCDPEPIVAITLGPPLSPMLEVFTDVEPSAATGWINMKTNQGCFIPDQVNIKYNRVFVLDDGRTADTITTKFSKSNCLLDDAICLLVKRDQVPSENIVYVSPSVNIHTISRLLQAYPQITIITASIDSTSTLADNH
jgi:uracil phosphoribosyltransferase